MKYECPIINVDDYRSHTQSYKAFIKTMTEISTPLLTADRIQYFKKVESHKVVFDTLTELLAKGQSEVTKYEIFDALVLREKLGSTSIGNGIAIPRAKLDLPNLRAALVIIEKGLDVNSADKQPVTFFLAILVPENKKNNYPSLLKKLNKNLTSKKALEKLKNTKNPEYIADYIQEIIND